MIASFPATIQPCSADNKELVKAPAAASQADVIQKGTERPHVAGRRTFSPLLTPFPYTTLPQTHSMQIQYAHTSGVSCKSKLIDY